MGSVELLNKSTFISKMIIFSHTSFEPCILMGTVCPLRVWVSSDPWHDMAATGEVSGWRSYDGREINFDRDVAVVLKWKHHCHP